MIPSTDRILLVDDDQSVLDALCRQHRKYYSIVAACGPIAGLRAIGEQGPFAVVVTDFNMPGMDGAQFLEKARELAPDMVRMMLTGHASAHTAVEAVNRGSIFRLMTKPCEPEAFTASLDAGIEQYQLRHAEHILLEHTLKGSIEVLADVLALASPATFGRARRIRDYVRHVVTLLKVPDAWQYEAAALLSQIGCIAVPDDVFDRLATGETLLPNHLAMIEEHPAVARELLRKIPRLESVAEMVFHQRATTLRPSDSRVVTLGARILAAAIDFDGLVSMGATPKAALDALRRTPAKYDTRVLDLLATAQSAAGAAGIRLLSISELEVGVVLAEEIRNHEGLLIVAQGHELTESSLRRIRNYGGLGQLPQVSFRVHVAPPADSDTAAA